MKMQFSSWTSFQCTTALKFCCIGLLLLSGCSTNYQAISARTNDAQWTNDAIGIVEALVDPARYESYPPLPPPDDGVVVQSDKPRIGLLNRTLARCPSGVVPDPKLSCIPSAVENRMWLILAEATWPKDLQERFSEILGSSQFVPDLQITGVVYISDQERVPSKVDSFIGLTKPVFSLDASKALVYVNHVCGATCGSSQLLFFERSDASWRVADSKILSQR